MNQIPQPQTEKKVYSLDGAVGTELEKRGANMDAKVWCGLSGKFNQDILSEIHQDYIYSGAEIIIANTFSTSKLMLENLDMTDSEIEEINIKTIQVAKESAIKAGNKLVVVAGSLSTLIPFRHGQKVLQGSTPSDINEDRFNASIDQMIGFFEMQKVDVVMQVSFFY